MSSIRKCSPAAYRAPLEHFDVEATAQRLFRYFQANAEDAAILAQDPTARDRALAKLNSEPDVVQALPNNNGIVGPYQLVPLGADVNAYLAHMDSVIDKPVFTTEERVKRAMATMSALQVFLEYKIHLALDDEFEDQVMARSDELWHTWVPQLTGKPCSSSNVRGKPSVLSEGDVQDILGHLELLCELRFKRSDTTQDEHTWRVVSFAGTERGIEYKVLCEGDSDPIPMDRKELMGLLRSSMVVVPTSS